MSGLSPEALGSLRDWSVDPSSIVPLAGDASTRRYLRGSRAGRSVVVMDCGERLPPVTGGRDGFAFTRWQAFYRRLGIRVPEVLEIDRDAGLVLLEDLGDELLQHRVEADGADACERLYLRAAHWASLLAVEGSRAYDPAADPDEDPLVAARLALEMDLLLVHATRTAPAPGSEPLAPLRRAERTLDATSDEGLLAARALLHRLCDDVHAAGPLALCHRDYHARNLILAAGDVAVIDFQDTRRGPRAYDLASLAWDPYVTLPPGLTGRLQEALRPEGAGAEAWDCEVRLAAGQRLLKAAGSYAWLSRERRLPRYEQWLQPALSRAHERLSRWEPRDELWAALRLCGAVG